ncbi:DEAD/DEAH box helicase family protein [Anaerotignum propionicum]|uniref:Type III restriction enzyme n=1 Tax=Anaerotignum propionicum DSM 1682 TaxID=991789 RepID=A0A0X1U906_ANAPI|nr:DEAD/DEAH box helicase family protein [Anaerotignum propionicum]AMJ41440.1 type III restriction enzyme, res subunit [Anaerotignum propionicum DSM 1682]SHE68432.1 type III restriction enzyme [[Clostridium] propionicum DSM 1682] [Anaerotignum propionicum DSM 1682]
MAKRIAFQFDDELDYQLQAIKSTVKLFQGLPRQTDGIYRTNRTKKVGEGDPVRNQSIVTGSRLLQNLREVQLENKLFADNALANNNFTIEMETGTGKTYVYLRTILELYKEYDFKKFMIVVPSIAIRKGVEKSIEQLKDHFKRLYDVDLSKHSFIYDSNIPKKISSSLIETNDLSICVMNIQVFNKDTNKIRTEDEYGQILWEDIKYIKPIVIIDEPQKIEGQKGKKSKSLQAIEDIEPLFVLRYSATHKQLYNQIYKLDSYTAYKDDLVKKIQVKTVNGIIEKDYPYIRYVAFTKDLKARIEMFSQKQGDSIRFKSFDVSANTSLEELSGGLVQYRNMRVAEEPHKQKPLKISTTEGMITLELGESNNGLEDSEATRIQIRLAIKNHFEKQLSILKSGKRMKALTLFFVDAVRKVRDHSRPDGRGEYLRIFDEEYAEAIKTYENQIEKYKEYFPEYQDVLKVREGYFALDKKKNEVEIEDWDDSKGEMEIKAKSQEDIDRGISLILEKKDELISFEEPLGFIFSHSALREGWDNPNVFTLCTLKNGSSDIAKKQEIGRGLRLPVDITGNRCLDAEVNELTVIANDSYENFSRVLQEDFNQSMNFNQNEVTADILTVTLEKAGVPEEKITAELVDTFKQELIRKGIFDSNNILNKNIEQTTKLLADIVFEDEILKEHAINLKEYFAKLMVQKGSHRIEIKNGDNEPYVNTIRAFVSEYEFQKIYFGLFNSLKKRTLYKCKVDKEKFIEGCIKEINTYLQFFKINKAVNIVTGKAGFNDAQMFAMEKSGDKTFDLEVGIKVAPKSDFEIVNYIMYHTMLPRLAIFKILHGIEKREALNFQDILDKITQKILVGLNNAKAANISSYEVIDGYELEEGQIFAIDTINEEDFNEEWRVFKSSPNRKNALNEYYKMDSKGEKAFAEKLEANENIVLFTKLKKGGFVIDTPYGNYSPDWAIVCRKEGLEEGAVGIYFIVETKADKAEKDLTDVEINKIHCGELHFQAVSDLVKFDWVNSYEDFRKKFGVKDTI